MQRHVGAVDLTHGLEAWFPVPVDDSLGDKQRTVEGMLARNSRKVLFMSSESALNPAPEMAHYSATKTMQISLSRSLAELTEGTDVTVNPVLPGSTRTEGVMKFVQDVSPDLPYDQAEKKLMQKNRATSLIQRLISPRCCLCV